MRTPTPPRATLALSLVLVGLAACGLMPDKPLVPLARTCGQWEELALEDQLTTAEALVADRLEAARRSQQLPETATRDEIVRAVNGSIEKVCLIERRPELPLADIITELYGRPG